MVQTWRCQAADTLETRSKEVVVAPLFTLAVSENLYLILHPATGESSRNLQTGFQSNFWTKLAVQQLGTTAGAPQCVLLPRSVSVIDLCQVCMQGSKGDSVLLWKGCWLGSVLRMVQKQDCCCCDLLGLILSQLWSQYWVGWFTVMQLHCCSALPGLETGSVSVIPRLTGSWPSWAACLCVISHLEGRQGGEGLLKGRNCNVAHTQKKKAWENKKLLVRTLIIRCCKRGMQADCSTFC